MKLFLLIFGFILGLIFCQFQVANSLNDLKLADNKIEQSYFTNWVSDCSNATPCSITITK